VAATVALLVADDPEASRALHALVVNHASSPQLWGPQTRELRVQFLSDTAPRDLVIRLLDAVLWGVLGQGDGEKHHRERALPHLRRLAPDVLQGTVVKLLENDPSSVSLAVARLYLRTCIHWSQHHREVLDLVLQQEHREDGARELAATLDTINTLHPGQLRQDDWSSVTGERDRLLESGEAGHLELGLRLVVRSPGADPARVAAAIQCLLDQKDPGAPPREVTRAAAWLESGLASASFRRGVSADSLSKWAFSHQPSSQLEDLVCTLDRCGGDPTGELRVALAGGCRDQVEDTLLTELARWAWPSAGRADRAWADKLRRGPADDLTVELEAELEKRTAAWCASPTALMVSPLALSTRKSLEKALCESLEGAPSWRELVRALRLGRLVASLRLLLAVLHDLKDRGTVLESAKDLEGLLQSHAVARRQRHDHPEEVLEALVWRVVDQLEPSVQGRVEVGPERSIERKAFDVSDLEVMVENLVNNALKYGSGVVKVRLTEDGLAVSHALATASAAEQAAKGVSDGLATAGRGKKGLDTIRRLARRNSMGVGAWARPLRNGDSEVVTWIRLRP